MTIVVKFLFAFYFLQSKKRMSYKSTFSKEYHKFGISYILFI